MCTYTRVRSLQSQGLSNTTAIEIAPLGIPHHTCKVSPTTCKGSSSRSKQRKQAGPHCGGSCTGFVHAPSPSTGTTCHCKYSSLSACHAARGYSHTGNRYPGSSMSNVIGSDRYNGNYLAALGGKPKNSTAYGKSVSTSPKPPVTTMLGSDIQYPYR